jgi:hypothetical protein
LYNNKTGIVAEQSTQKKTPALMTDLAIVCINGSSNSLDSGFYELATYLGIRSCLIEIQYPFSVESLASQLGSQIKNIGMSASTLYSIKTYMRSDTSFISWLADGGRQIFVYGFEPNSIHEQIVRWLTKGEVFRIIPIKKGERCAFPSEGSPFTRMLSGHDFSRRPRSSDCGFEIDQRSPSITKLMSIEDKATFLRTNGLGINLFLWAVKDIPPLKQKLAPDEELSDFYENILPPVVYVRHVFRGTCWENPARTARIIVDDPLLTDRYGFLNYDDLIRSIEHLDYAVTIAYIPWNYRRTNHKDAQVFLNNNRKVTVCIHGCDHVKNEFGITDRRILEQKASIAIARMVKHQERTGLPFEKIMVFPQGLFSRAAIKALRRTGYLAAVNTVRFPTDDEDDGITIADELLPVSNRYSGFPIFFRRYPKELAHIAVDMFLGKPTYIVEHHELFRNGCGALEHCIATLKAMEPSLMWPNISSAIQRIHMRKENADGDLDIRFFTSSFVFENNTGRKADCRFAKPEPEPDLIKAVFANDRSIEFQMESQSIEFRLELRPGENVRIRLEDREEPPMGVFRPNIVYRLKTGARRCLSEFRDNHLSRHPRLLIVAKRVVHISKASIEPKHKNTPD